MEHQTARASTLGDRAKSPWGTRRGRGQAWEDLRGAMARPASVGSASYKRSPRCSAILLWMAVAAIAACPIATEIWLSSSTMSPAEYRPRDAVC
jgi:hypothetical protein